jgi:hypothetical protein
VGLDAEQAEFEDLEQATGAGADDDDLGADGVRPGWGDRCVGQGGILVGVQESG